MEIYEKLVTVVELGPIETAILSVVLFLFLFVLVWSARTGFGGEFVGFDFSWIKGLLKRDGETGV